MHSPNNRPLLLCCSAGGLSAGDVLRGGNIQGSMMNELSAPPVRRYNNMRTTSSPRPSSTGGRQGSRAADSGGPTERSAGTATHASGQGAPLTQRVRRRRSVVIPNPRGSTQYRMPRRGRQLAGRPLSGNTHRWELTRRSHHRLQSYLIWGKALEPGNPCG